MSEINRTHITNEEWTKFLKDIVKTQDKHNIQLVPTLKLSPVTGISVEWGGLRPNETPETATTSDTGDTVSEA